MGYLAYTNPTIPSNLYRAKEWSFLLEEQSQRPNPKVTSSTELKSNSPLQNRIIQMNISKLTITFKLNQIKSTANHDWVNIMNKEKVISIFKCRFDLR